jgi:hypothetical protein
MSDKGEEYSLGASAAIADEKSDFVLVSRQYGGYGGGISTLVVKNIFQRYTFLLIVKKSSNSLSYAPCACCDGNAPYISRGEKNGQSNHHITVCPGCQASICYRCTEFVKQYSCAQQKRCRWCGTYVVPRCEVDLAGPLPPYVEELRCARKSFYTFSMWTLGILPYHRDFNFSGIFWASYFNQKGWRFYVDAEWFFNERLPNEYNIVMARMLILNSYRVSESLQQTFLDSYRRLHAHPNASLFFASSKRLQMYSFAFRMVFKTKTMNRSNCYGVLRRLRSVWALQMSNGLGVNIPAPKKSPEDDESCFWN